MMCHGIRSVPFTVALRCGAMPVEPARATPWEAVRDRLGGTRFADVRTVAETGSTNADVLELAREGAPEGIVLVADHQTAGRGRLDRRWEAPPGASLLMSILTRPHERGIPDGHLHLVTTAVGVAAAEAAREATGADIGLKWPNDLVVEIDGGTRKLSGLLAETVVEAGRVTALVVGIGINVTWPEVPVGDLAGVAVALNHLTDRSVDRADLLAALLAGFDGWYARLGTPEGVGELRGRYRTLSATLGRQVRVETPDGAVSGDAVDIDDEGRLLVVDDCPDRPRAIAVGDVIHVRPAS
jgi:BirA family transcriptional regulator, biotin operon repressor / biotin---[acetyl-CoA-carboxylase] ligase